jgi:hypothetical protein
MGHLNLPSKSEMSWRAGNELAAADGCLWNMLLIPIPPGTQSLPRLNTVLPTSDILIMQTGRCQSRLPSFGLRPWQEMICSSARVNCPISGAWRTAPQRQWQTHQQRLLS